VWVVGGRGTAGGGIRRIIPGGVKMKEDGNGTKNLEMPKKKKRNASAELL